jgi:hypothetical protein
MRKLRMTRQAWSNAGLLRQKERPAEKQPVRFRHGRLRYGRGFR